MYHSRVTQEEAAKQWQDGAERTLKAARDLFETENYEMTLFTSHLTRFHT